MKRLAIVATSYIIKYDGISVYTENLIRELLNSKDVKEKELYLDIYTGKTVLELLKSRVLKNGSNFDNVNFIAVEDKNIIVKMFSLVRLLRKNSKYDLVLMANFMPAFFVNSKTVKVIHDFSINHNPELFSKGYFVYHHILLLYAKYFDEGIGYISKTTLDDLKQYYNINKGKKLLYLPNGIPFKVKQYKRPCMDEFEKKFQSKELNLLVVGRINKHKGFDRILEFCKYYDNKLLNESFFDSVTLNISGKQTKETKELLQGLNLQKIKLIFHGFVNDKELNKLYTNSHFCFFLSRNEGYGLPLVEAMWFRTFPILSDIPIFNEIMGNKYKKFNNDTGYTDEIGNFIENIFFSKSLRTKYMQDIDRIVQRESKGYSVAASNVINFLFNKDKYE